MSRVTAVVTAAVIAIILASIGIVIGGCASMKQDTFTAECNCADCTFRCVGNEHNTVLHNRGMQ